MIWGVIVMANWLVLIYLDVRYNESLFMKVTVTYQRAMEMFILSIQGLLQYMRPVNVY